MRIQSRSRGAMNFESTSSRSGSEETPNVEKCAKVLEKGHVREWDA